MQLLIDKIVELYIFINKDHAESMGESATAFINRAIDEAMARDHKVDLEN